MADSIPSMTILCQGGLRCISHLVDLHSGIFAIGGLPGGVAAVSVFQPRGISHFYC